MNAESVSAASKEMYFPSTHRRAVPSFGAWRNPTDAYLPEQDLLLPPSLGDWLPEDHLAYFVSDVVDQLDLRAIESVYEEEERG
jgi:hypothetical protein